MADFKVLLTLVFLSCVDPLAAQGSSIMINEIGWSNGLTDEDGDHIG